MPKSKLMKANSPVGDCSIAKLVSVLSAALILVTVGACSIRPDGPTYYFAPKPPESSELSTIYLMRLGYEQNAGGRTWFYVDDASIFNSYERSYSWVQVPPGKHTIKVQVGFWDYDLNIAKPNNPNNKALFLLIQTEPGKTYYVRYERINAPRQTRTGIAFVGNPILAIPTTEHSHERLSDRLFLEDPEKALSDLFYLLYVE